MNEEIEDKDGAQKTSEELLSLFSVPLAKTTIGRSFTEKEIDCIVNIPMIYNKEAQGAQGSQSEYFDIFDNAKTKKELKDIKTFCERKLKRYMEEIEGVNTNSVTLQITESWLNKLKPQDHHTLHNHRNSHLSGILYIRCLPNDSIQFANRNLMFDQSLELPKKKTTQFTAKEVIVNIKEGDFIIFPSWVPHQVRMNETKNKERISLSFDTWPKHLPSLYPPFK